MAGAVRPRSPLRQLRFDFNQGVANGVVQPTNAASCRRGTVRPETSRAHKSRGTSSLLCQVVFTDVLTASACRPPRLVTPNLCHASKCGRKDPNRCQRRLHGEVMLSCTDASRGWPPAPLSSPRKCRAAWRVAPIRSGISCSDPATNLTSRRFMNHFLRHANSSCKELAAITDDQVETSSPACSSTCLPARP